MTVDGVVRIPKLNEGKVNGHNVCLAFTQGSFVQPTGKLDVYGGQAFKMFDTNYYNWDILK